MWLSRCLSRTLCQDYFHNRHVPFVYISMRKTNLFILVTIAIQLEKHISVINIVMLFQVSFLIHAYSEFPFRDSKKIIFVCRAQRRASKLSSRQWYFQISYERRFFEQDFWYDSNFQFFIGWGKRRNEVEYSKCSHWRNRLFDRNRSSVEPFGFGHHVTKNTTDNNRSKVKSSMENLVESFITELECHRRNISKEIEDVANTRINELNATLKRLEEVRSRTWP